jgi:hypothetical protein
MTTVLTLLRRGGDFKDEHVERIRQQIEPYTKDFICIDDAAMTHDWPRWWPKIEMFKHRGPCLYFDLDTTIVGDITPMLDAAHNHEFIALRNLGKDVPIGSGIMAWNGDLSRLYHKFARRPDLYMHRYRKFPNIGDQGFIWDNNQVHTTFWQDLFPGQILSYKFECKASVPKDAMVVYFHGKPRPWDVEL